MLFAGAARGGLVQVKDSVGGEERATLPFFAAAWRLLALTTVADLDGNGADEIAVLAERLDCTGAAIRIKDTATGRQTGRIRLGKTPDEHDTALPTTTSLDGNATPELAVLR